MPALCYPQPVPEDLAAIARSILLRALHACDIRTAIARAIHLSPGALTIAGQTFPLAQLDALLVIAIGKAAVPMHEAALRALDRCLPATAIVVAPPQTLPLHDLGTIFLPGDHPTPTPNSVLAARTILAALAAATPRTAVLFLISGGASAMVELPLAASVSLDDLAATHRALVAAGLPIGRMNAIRKHLSAIKGGRLAAAAAHTAAQITLLVSDVPPGHEHVIASGPTLPDPTTLADARQVLADLEAHAATSGAPSLAVPSAVRSFLRGPIAPETLKPHDPAFARASHAVLLSSRDLAQAAAAAASDLGFHAEIDLASEGVAPHPELDHRALTQHLLDRSAALARQHPRSCLINAGEISVALNAHPGQGGRNQHCALYAATQLAQRRQSATILSAGSDGIDGNSFAAGAVCDEHTIPHAQSLGFDPAQALADCNAGPLLQALEAQIVTGPTGNNLRDLRLILTGGAGEASPANGAAANAKR